MKIGNGLLILPRVLLSRKIRGGTKLTQFLAKHFGAFRSFKATVPGGSVFVDLRSAGGQGYLNRVEANAEHLVIDRCIRPADVAYDIGANVGLYTVWLSSLVGPAGKVFSFEPNPFHAKGLARTVESIANAQVFNLGLSDHPGTFDLFVPEDDTMASLTDWTEDAAGRVRREVCTVTTIDRLIEEGKMPRPDFIKCDIEGGEVDCFRGAKKTLNSVEAPVILFEANINSTKGFGNSISSGMDFLADLDRPQYRFFLVEDDASLKPIHSIDFLHGNILAVPGLRSGGIVEPYA